MSDSPSPREALKAALVPLLPSNWKIDEHQKIPETISTTTVVLKFLAIDKIPSHDWLSNTVTLTVYSRLEDQAKAEDELDDDFLTLVHALDSLKGLSWSDAKKIQTGAYLGWDINLKVISRKKPTEE